MTLEEFRATRRPISDATWVQMRAEEDAVPARESLFEYDEGYVISERGAAGKRFYVYGYSLRYFRTQNAAEEALFHWRGEFQGN